MASQAQQLVGRFSTLSNQPVARQMSLLLGLAASVALGVGLVQWAMEPDYQPLFGDLAPSSAMEITRVLEASGERYRVDARTGLVTVPGDRVRQLRLQLASEGLPQQPMSGFDMLNGEQAMGVSSFMEKARFDRALEQELSASIASLENVRTARVHLALPKQSAFVRKRSKPAASVLVSLFPGTSLSDRQLAGVVHLVAFSVPGLEAEQVSVVDSRGKLLSSQGGEDGLAASAEQFRYTQQLEQNYADRIVEILTPILGVDAVRAQVAADVNFTAVETTSERYAPEAAVRSERLVEELSSDAGASGVPGTLSNRPPEPAPPEAVDPAAPAQEENRVAASPQRSSKQEVRNYELDKTISHVRETPGTINKLSVAVVVDYREQLNDAGEAERAPLPEEQLAEITALVKEAVGFDEQRGDRVNVVNASFVAEPALEPMPEASLLQQEWIWRLGKLLVAATAVIATLLLVVRPLMKIPAPAIPAAPGLPGQAGVDGVAVAQAEGLALGEDRVSLGHQPVAGLPSGEPAYQQQLSMARNLVEGEPERAAHVLKTWVAADG